MELYLYVRHHTENLKAALMKLRIVQSFVKIDELLYMKSCDVTDTQQLHPTNLYRAVRHQSMKGDLDIIRDK